MMTPIIVITLGLVLVAGLTLALCECAGLRKDVTGLQAVVSPLPATPPATAEVRNSHGTFLIDNAGVPLNHARVQELLDCDICRFDLDRYYKQHGKYEESYDIVSLGYWCRLREGTAHYEPPIDWG